MATYVLDTNVLIDYSLRIDRVVRQVVEWGERGDIVGIACVQVAEFFTGMTPIDRDDAQAFLNGFVYWPVSEIAARYAGSYRYDFARVGVQLSIPDTIIAGVARSQSGSGHEQSSRFSDA
jgi:tRNA(fMet)-specific endonuclease VapC